MSRPYFSKVLVPIPGTASSSWLVYRAAGGQSPEGAVAEDSERRQATPPGLDETPDAQRRFEAGVHPGF